MGWEEGEYFEELARKQEETPAYYCPWCKKETDLWFDRTITCFPDGTEEGMKDRCIECGRATDDLPEIFTEEDDDMYLSEPENDGG